MIAGRLLGAGRLAEVLEDGAYVIKLYRPGVGPEQAQHEAKVLDALRGTSLVVPDSLGVCRVEERWGLRMSRLPGAALGSLMSEGDMPGLVAIFAGLHRAVLANTARGLPPIKPRLMDRIARAPHLAPAMRERVLQRLAALPDGDRLCHGDFHPFNIMVDGDRSGIIDWLDATLGPAAADIARSYMLVALHRPALAALYLEAMTEDGKISRQQVMDWLPVVAGARLAEQVDGEADRLLAWCELA
ncbi:aminoglycoside phosphotransferase family protein [Devosia sp. XK-2]|uniref:phosphotransferase family protein n=1 Tax=Devosia sp. XK-2 TaxID=3126689 RepID=UPI0030CBE83F